MVNGYPALIMEPSNSEILQRFPQTLRRNVEELFTGGPIGLSCLNVRLTLNSKKFGAADVTRDNSFVLDVPYAGKHLSWEVLFNDEDLTFAPDFDFQNDQFLQDPDLDVIENEIPTLANWDVENPKALITVLRELLTLYKKYQLERLQEEKFQTFYTEYTLLTGEVGLPEDAIEVFVDNNDQVHFLVAIRVDFSKLPPYTQPSYHVTHKILNPCEDAAMLRVTFTGARVNTQLQFSPRLEDVIGGSNKLSIPQYNKESGLVEYVPAVSNLIVSKIDHIVDGYRTRSEYISTVLAYQAKSVLEYDKVTFSKVTLLLCCKERFAIVIISLGKNFPQEKPTLQLNSVYCEVSDKPVIENITDYPYSSSWTPKEMVQKLLTYLQTAVPKFHENSLEYQSQGW